MSTGPGVTRFGPQDHILLPKAVNDGTSPDHHIFNQYTIRSAHRDALRAHLASKGIGSEIYYPVPFHRQECFASLGCVDADYPVSNCLAATVLSVPIFPELTEGEIREVVETIAAFERTMADEPAECASCDECGTHA
jgi:dTDP-4-amino-4,6-dideoxygalactose transaminase